MKLKNGTRKKIDEINILETELESNQELSMYEEFETGELLWNLYSNKIGKLDEILLKERKLQKIGVSERTTDTIKEWNSLRNLSYWFLNNYSKNNTILFL